jgi:hypothetical protein
VKPFSRSPPRGWSQNTNLGEMRHPKTMTSEELGLASISAAREQVDSPKLWTMLTERAMELSTDMEPRDIALLLNGLSRTRCLSYFPNLVKGLSPAIIPRLAYFSSIQIAMILSSISKLSDPVSYCPPEFLHRLRKEISNRLHEFTTPVEISMVMNSIVKLDMASETTMRRFSSLIQSRLFNFHIREISIISHAFSVSGIRDTVLFDKLVERAIPSLGEATPIEISRFSSSLARAGMHMHANRILAAVDIGRLKYLSSSDLVSTIYSFCQMCDYSDRRDYDGDEHQLTHRLNPIFANLKASFISSFSVLQLGEIASIMTSFTRWRVGFSVDEKLLVLNKLGQIRADILVDYNTCSSIISSVGSWYDDSPESVCEQVSAVLRKFYPSFVQGLSDRGDDWQSASRAIVVLVNSMSNTRDLVHAFERKILKHGNIIDRTSRLILIDSLGESIGRDHDLVLALSEGITN